MRDFNNTSDESEFDRDYLACASRLAETLDGDAFSEVASAIALQYVEAGNLDRGVELAEQIPDVYARDSLISVIAAKAVASGTGDYALELLDTIDDPILANSAIEAMSIEFARRGEFDTALDLAGQLSDNGPALGSIAVLYWQNGRKEEALDLARSIEFAQQGATTLVQLAKLTDDNDEGLNLLAEARTMAEEIDSAELKVFALMAIASGYEERSDRDQALEALNRAIEVCDDFESGSLVGLSGAFAKDEALLQLVEALLRIDDLSQASDLSEEIEDRFVFAAANLRLAIGRGKDRESGEAAKHLDEVKEMIVETDAYGQQEANVRDGLIIDLAMAYANTGDYAQARRTIELVISGETAGLALKELGKLCGTAGHNREVSEIAETLQSAYDKVQYWLGIYDATTSEAAMTNAMASAASLEQPVEKAEALTQIAARFANSQRTGDAETTFLAATNAALLIEGSFLKTRAFLRLAATGRKPNRDEQRLIEEMIAHL